jgi:uncharacterized DUF497 family protein
MELIFDAIKDTANIDKHGLSLAESALIEVGHPMGKDRYPP